MARGGNEGNTTAGAQPRRRGGVTPLAAAAAAAEQAPRAEGEFDWKGERMRSMGEMISAVEAANPAELPGFVRSYRAVDPVNADRNLSFMGSRMENERGAELRAVVEQMPPADKDFFSWQGQPLTTMGDFMQAVEHANSRQLETLVKDYKQFAPGFAADNLRYLASRMGNEHGNDLERILKRFEEDQEAERGALEYEGDEWVRGRHGFRPNPVPEPKPQSAPMQPPPAPPSWS